MAASRLLVLCMVICCSSSPAGTPVTIESIHNASTMKYFLHHPLHEVEATCKDVECRIAYDRDADRILHAFFSADVSSFDSGNSNRDSHAMEVLDAIDYPAVSFESSTITASDGHLAVTGNLTFHGRTKPVAFGATTTTAGDTLSVDGNTTVSLTAFSIDRPSLLMIPVDDSLKISFDVKFLVRGR